VLPMIMEKSLQAQFMIPMAVSLGFGTLFSSTISLILVPSMYRISVDIGDMLGRLFSTGATTAPEQPELQPALAMAGVAGGSEMAPDVVAAAPAAGDGRTEWHVGLDEAYERGYKAALEGQPRQAEFELEVLAASWEAGWDDGAEEARRS